MLTLIYLCVQGTIILLRVGPYLHVTGAISWQILFYPAVKKNIGTIHSLYLLCVYIFANTTFCYYLSKRQFLRNIDIHLTFSHSFIIILVPLKFLYVYFQLWKDQIYIPEIMGKFRKDFERNIFPIWNELIQFSEAYDQRKCILDLILIRMYKNIFSNIVLV